MRVCCSCLCSARFRSCSCSAVSSSWAAHSFALVAQLLLVAGTAVGTAVVVPPSEGKSVIDCVFGRTRSGLCVTGAVLRRRFGGMYARRGA